MKATRDGEMDGSNRSSVASFLFELNGGWCIIEKQHEDEESKSGEWMRWRDDRALNARWASVALSIIDVTYANYRSNMTLSGFPAERDRHSFV
jgi:hypothetical protein